MLFGEIKRQKINCGFILRKKWRNIQKNIYKYLYFKNPIHMKIFKQNYDKNLMYILKKYTKKRS